MTLKNRQNHYNVKFLPGYGLSISLKNNKIVLKDGTYPNSDIPEQEEWFITQLPYEKIVISGKGYISAKAISLLNHLSQIIHRNRHRINQEEYLFEGRIQSDPCMILNQILFHKKIQESNSVNY